jgi:hypothetical protein
MMGVRSQFLIIRALSGTVHARAPPARSAPSPQRPAGLVGRRVRPGQDLHSPPTHHRKRTPTSSPRRRVTTMEYPFAAASRCVPPPADPRRARLIIFLLIITPHQAALAAKIPRARIPHRRVHSDSGRGLSSHGRSTQTLVYTYMHSDLG